MKEFLTYVGRRIFVEMPSIVTIPVFVFWVLAVYFAIFGETALSASYWFRVGLIVVMTIMGLAIIFPIFRDRK